MPLGMAPELAAAPAGASALPPPARALAVMPADPGTVPPPMPLATPMPADASRLTSR
jgi:hypothetical protein